MKFLKQKIVEFKNSETLSGEISGTVGILVVVCMAIMVVVSTILSRNYLQSSINAEFAGIADKNGVMVQKILDEAVTTATNLKNYVEEMYTQWGENGYNGDVEKSVLYDVELQEMNKQIEDYILYTGWSVLSNSDYIEGVGAFFERVRLTRMWRSILFISIHRMQPKEVVKAMAVIPIMVL